MKPEIINLIPSIIIGATGVFAAIWFNRSSLKRENDKILKQLFTEFNSRYAELNDKLVAFVDANEGEQTINNCNDGTKNDVIDYFNLCAEQYFWYKRKRIDEDLWLSWNTGMNYWYSFDCIKELWQEETKSREGKISYYIRNGNEFFRV